MRKRRVLERKVFSKRKLVIVPFCLAKCVTREDHGYYRCRSCGKCQVSIINSIARKRGFSLFIVGSKTMARSIRRLYVEGKKVIAFGFLCDDEIEEKREQLKDVDIEKVFLLWGFYKIPKACEGGTVRIDFELFDELLSHLD